MSIIWLASYPKSGNTWLRIFLTNYVRDADEPADINDMEKWGISSAHSLVEQFTGMETSDLTADEIDALRPDVYRFWAEAKPDPLFVKAHDACTLLPDGRPLFPNDATRAAIYVVRNPLDVAVSMMHHMGDPQLDKTIARMADPQATLAASSKRGNNQFRQKLLSWSQHVDSWLDTPKPFSVHLLRYEDMTYNPENTFASVITFCGLPLHQERLGKAIDFSRFDVLQQQETQHGFRERPRAQLPFFRRGRIGDWRNHMTPAQVQRVVADHHTVMERCGYLSPAGELTF